MLGLSSGLTHQNAVKKLITVYESDFSSGTDGWAGNSIQGTLNLDSNETIDGSSGWLKLTFDDAQTNSWSIGKDLSSTTESNVGDEYFVTFKAVFIDDGGKWDADDDDDHVASKMEYMGGLGLLFSYPYNSYGSSVSLDSNETYSGANVTRRTIVNDSDLVRFLRFSTYVTDDYPKAGAICYIKDVKLQLLTLATQP